MAAQDQALLFNSRSYLKKFAKGVRSGADPHRASLRKYFICTNIYDEAFTEYPCKGWQELVDCFCMLVDKCDSLQVLVIHSAAFTSMEEVEIIASTIKELAGQVLGHHPNLTRLVQYGPANATTDVGYVKWALIDKDNSRLGSWAPNNDSRVLSEHKDLSQGGRRLQMTREQKRARDWMMSEMGGSSEDDPDSPDEDAANTDEDKVNDEGNADKEETDANGDGADCDNNEYDDSETEPEADDEDEDDELREDANDLDQQTDMMDEDAPRIKRQRVE
ncbi:hypothetical protein EPUS_06906 [Endocarpon pusillum Z07020]|uniref:Uncharacterized protein n=1 Tax=Endocarpon pusillum (strain Z07020 / HMAS-L-300199) TaxID=1263415 RepID=U1HDK4_ENDPU|nr:uncharacterized protein EPUS_06906 [Endocarpon pusillum Z07020]ERF68095.1 hypothetical protein EPUS_06906 [Endocarpon pusillum Z07020]